MKDSDFEKELKNVENRVKSLLQVAKQGSGSEFRIDANFPYSQRSKLIFFCLFLNFSFFLNFFPDENKTLVEQLDELRDQLNQIEKISQSVDATAEDARRTTNEGLTSIDEAERVLDQIYEQLTVTTHSISSSFLAQTFYSQYYNRLIAVYRKPKIISRLTGREHLLQRKNEPIKLVNRINK